MYLHRPQATWRERLFGSVRTLAAIVITALLASALTVRWSDALATGSPVLAPGFTTTAATIPISIEGTLVGASDGLVALVERGAEAPVAFTVSQTAELVRQGESVPLDALRAGDTVNMTIDGLTGSVLRLHAEPAASAPFPPRVSGSAALLAALGLIAGATALAIRNPDRLPKLPARFATTRLLSAAASR